MDNRIMPGQMPYTAAVPQAPGETLVSRENVDDLAREAAHRHPAVASLEKTIDELSRADEWVKGALSLKRDERLEVIRTTNIFDLQEKEEAIHRKLHSNSFRIWACSVLAGAASAMGTVAAVAAGMIVPTPVAVLFPATLGLGVGISRLYKAGAEKWIAPERLDKFAVETLQNKQQSIRQKREKAEEELMTTIDKVARENSEFAQAGMGQQPTGSDIVIEEESLEIDGVRIPINKKFEQILAMSRVRGSL